MGSILWQDVQVSPTQTSPATMTEKSVICRTIAQEVDELKSRLPGEGLADAQAA